MKIRKILKIILSILGISFLIFFIFFFVGRAPKAEKITWGISFSQKQAELLKIPWKENYLAILDDLKAPAIKITAYWDLIEQKPDEYYFDDLDFQVKEAENRNVKIILTLGRKVPRWPECHIPDWAKNLNQQEQEKKLLEYLKKIVLRYQDSKMIWAWQVENEPFFPFGECPSISENFLKEEISLVKSSDYKNRPVIISDSGSSSFWIKTAELGDMVSISLYKKVWFHEFNAYVDYPFPGIFYWRKAQIIKTLFGKDVICGELQTEPWGPILLNDLSLEEQQKTMNLEQFRKNIELAKNTGFNQFYFWGAEWWYWMKTTQNQPEIWNEAKKLIGELK